MCQYLFYIRIWVIQICDIYAYIYIYLYSVYYVIYCIIRKQSEYNYTIQALNIIIENYIEYDIIKLVKYKFNNNLVIKFVNHMFYNFIFNLIFLYRYIIYNTGILTMNKMLQIS